jgi:hypothetical protein
MSPELWAPILRTSGPILGWSIWYAGGLVVRSTELSWARAPRIGVQALMTYHPTGRNLHAAKDEYTLPGEATTKLGLMIDFARFEAILRSAEADPWRPPTTATTPTPI